MPYFSYTTCLHLYETLGWWRTGGLRVIHFAEEWNELHHRAPPASSCQPPPLHAAAGLGWAPSGPAPPLVLVPPAGARCPPSVLHQSPPPPP